MEPHLETRKDLVVKFGLGLVIGKFLPPHRGHKFLIETAAAQSERTVVILCAKPSDFVAGEVRGEWLRELHPDVEVRVIDDRFDENDSKIWAENTLRWLGCAPDAVFSSEDYGERYAAHMGSKHVSVDRHRVHLPVSGTAVRNNPFAHWNFIEPPIRAWFTKRVCVLGAESTGTTTLARALAQHFNTTWVEEYGRTYSLRKQSEKDTIWRSDEFVHIAAEQSRQENVAARASTHVVVCDTNALATVVWHRRYVGGNNPQLDAIAHQVRCDLYLLTGDEIPFVQDGLRDGPHLRHLMHEWFVETLAAQSVPWILLRGSPEHRLGEAVAAVKRLFDRAETGFALPRRAP